MLHVKHQQKQKAKYFTWNTKKKEAKCFTWNIKSTGRGVLHVKHERKSCRKRNDSMFFVQS